ncbi:IS3 family transposase [Enterococcus gallinarum]|uniref:IS3 family transposase n=1 Tax=Enterococcus gallinarum TaxID=1353 RepID=UPI002B1CBD33|nr:IS3 family transposase [Enterococcus gallinarum]
MHAILHKRLRAISLLQSEHTISKVCRVLKVNPSTFYKYNNRKSSARFLENHELKRLILQIYTETNYRLGAAKLQILLQREYGVSISIGRVYRLMKSMNLPTMATVKPKFRYHKPTVSLAYPNLVQQQFETNPPNKVWTSDISYTSVKNGFVYLCIILNLFSRKVIAWNVYNKMTASLVFDTLEKAASKRKPIASVIFHSDRG